MKSTTYTIYHVVRYIAGNSENPTTLGATVHEWLAEGLLNTAAFHHPDDQIVVHKGTCQMLTASEAVSQHGPDQHVRVQHPGCLQVNSRLGSLLLAKLTASHALMPGLDDTE